MPLADQDEMEEELGARIMQGGHEEVQESQAGESFYSTTLAPTLSLEVDHTAGFHTPPPPPPLLDDTANAREKVKGSAESGDSNKSGRWTGIWSGGMKMLGL